MVTDMIRYEDEFDMEKLERMGFSIMVLVDKTDHKYGYVFTLPTYAVDLLTVKWNKPVIFRIEVHTYKKQIKWGAMPEVLFLEVYSRIQETWNDKSRDVEKMPPFLYKVFLEKNHDLRKRGLGINFDMTEEEIKRRQVDSHLDDTINDLWG
jgi:hypothetical protein